MLNVEGKPGGPEDHLGSEKFEVRSWKLKLAKPAR
jgi:hypothetical protein